MKKVKKVIYIILIFSILQLCGIGLACNNVYATGFFDKVFDNGKKWSQMGSDDADNLINNANSIFEATTEIFDTIRIIGAVMIFMSIGLTAIALRMKSNGEDKAGLKETIVITLVLAVLFIFADSIINGLITLFSNWEDTI